MVEVNGAVLVNVGDVVELVFVAPAVALVVLVVLLVLFVGLVVVVFVVLMAVVVVVVFVELVPDDDKEIDVVAVVVLL